MSFLSRLSLFFTIAFIGLTSLSQTSYAQNIVANKVEAYHTGHLYGSLAQRLEHPLQVKVWGPQRRTWLGGTRRDPAEGATVQFELSPQAKRWGARLVQETAKADAGGIARTELILGNHPGTYGIKAYAIGKNGEKVGPVTFELLGGVIIKGNDQDARAGNPASEPLEVTLESAPGQPLVGAEIGITFMKTPGKAKVKPERAYTDPDGKASFLITPGDKNGAMTAMVQIQRPTENDPDRQEILGSTRVRFFSFAPFSLLIQVAGGLAIFIFGMTQLSNALTMIAGDKLRQWLNFLTRNRVMGVLAGTLVTGLIQSSSATSVMVIGFVNAGLFELRQAISVIFGANIGTTITAQMISFKLDHLALPSIAIGITINLLAKRERNREWASVLIGFGLLFLGLTMMSTPLKGLKESQMMADLFAGLTCAPVDGHISLLAPLLGVIVGMVVTVAVQSSSASIGLMLALVGTGIIDVWAGFTILLGSNIGTTVTAVLAAIGSNRTAKRTALAHALFNLIGVVIMYGLLFIPIDNVPCFMWLIDHITPGNAFVGENVERYIANAHTVFNTLAALIFLPFIGGIVALCYAIIPRSEEEKTIGQIQYLDSHLLATPSVAIAQVYRELGYMGRQGRRALEIAAEVTRTGSQTEFEKQYERIHRRSARLDRIQEEILNYIEQISQRNLSEEQSAQLPHLVQAVNDTERIGDHCVSLLKLHRRLIKRQMEFTEEGKRDLSAMFDTVLEMYDRVQKGLESADPKALDRIVGMKKQLSMMRKDLRKAHLARLESGQADVRSGMVFIEMISLLEEISHLLGDILEGCNEIFNAHTPSLRPENKYDEDEEPVLT